MSKGGRLKWDETLFSGAKVRVPRTPQAIRRTGVPESPLALPASPLGPRKKKEKNSRKKKGGRVMGWRGGGRDDYSRVKHINRMVHPSLQSAIQVRESLCARAEPHVLAQIVPRSLGGGSSVGVTFHAETAFAAWDAHFESDSLAYP